MARAKKERRERRSRFGTEPRIGPDGKPVIIPSRELSLVAVGALKFLTRRRVASYYYVAAGIGAHWKTVQDLFSDLRADGNEYIKLVPEQANNPKQHLKSKLYFELAEAGVTALEERGFKVPKRNPMKRLKHQVMIDEIMTSWEIGFNQNEELTAIWWPEIKASEKTPGKTRELPNAHQIPVTFIFDGKRVDRPYIADDRPFVRLNGERRAYCFPGIEADCDSESIRSDYDAYTSIKRKLLQQIAIIEQELYRSHFGFPNIFFPYYFPTLRRMESAMELLEELTAHRPSLRKSFVFAVHPTFTNFEYEKIEPSGWALTRDYRRVGYEPLNFGK